MGEGLFDGEALLRILLKELRKEEGGKEGRQGVIMCKARERERG
jgi:hypothetical protein